MRKQLLGITILLTMSGCMSFVDTLGTVQDAAIQARMTFQPVIDNICRQYAIECQNERALIPTSTVQDASACEQFEVCDAVRLQVAGTLGIIQMAIADANMSYSIGDSQSADEAIAKALQLIEKLRNQLRGLGYLK